MNRRGFTLIELLVVVGIIAVLIAIILPATAAVRRQAQKCVCASNLRQVGNSLMLYVQDHKGRLPYIHEPMWNTVASTGLPSLSIDPRSEPKSFINVMERYGVTSRLLTCPSFVLRSTTDENEAPVQTYRFSSANNADGFPKLNEQLVLPGGQIDYKYSLKYLNGRRYEMNYAMLRTLPGGMIGGVLFKGVGPFYLARDYVAAKTTGLQTVYTPPHNKQFNQLKIDMSVSLEKDEVFGFASP